MLNIKISAPPRDTQWKYFLLLFNGSCPHFPHYSPLPYPPPPPPTFSPSPTPSPLCLWWKRSPGSALVPSMAVLIRFLYAYVPLYSCPLRRQLTHRWSLRLGHTRKDKMDLMVNTESPVLWSRAESAKTSRDITLMTLLSCVRSEAQVPDHLHFSF